MGQRGYLRALAGICDFHKIFFGGGIQMEVFMGRPHTSADCLKRHQVQARLPQSKQRRI